MTKLYFKRVFQATALCAGLFCCARAQASFVFGLSSAMVNQTGDFILGDNFVVNSPVTITQLGVLVQDLPQTGAGVPIAIYEHTGSTEGNGWTLVGTSYTITSSDPIDSPDQTRYTTISPLTLGPGLYSVVTATASDYNSGNPLVGPSSVSFNSVGGALTLSQFDIWSVYSGSSLPAALTGMGTTGPGDPVYPWPVPVFGAGTFSAIQAVPEAPTVIAGLLLLLPFGASMMRILRKRSLASSLPAGAETKQVQ